MCLSVNTRVQYIADELFKDSVDVQNRGSLPREKEWYEERNVLVEKLLSDLKVIDKKYGFDELLPDDEALI